MARLKGCLAVLAVAVIAAVSLSVARRADASGSATEYWLSYTIDRSALSGQSWIAFPAVTLCVTVGDVDKVEAYSDGRSVAVRYDQTSSLKRAIVTTEGTRVDLRLTNLRSSPSGIGSVSVAKLRDDKRWAYSLTFDDGFYSVWTNGKAYLDRVGQRAGVAVIGLFLFSDLPLTRGDPGFDLNAWIAAQPERQDSPTLGKGYMGPAQLRELQAAGWSLFNHTYSHSLGVPDNLKLQDILATNLAIERIIPGYHVGVFTVPLGDTTYGTVSDDAALGLRLRQTWETTAMPRVSVDGTLTVNPTYLMGRYDVGEYEKYMSVTHNMVVSSPNTHYWLSMHAHGIDPERSGAPEADWAWLAADAAQFAYGPGGTDELWVAPADEVFNYWYVRDRVQVSRLPDNAPSAVLQDYPLVSRVVLRNTAAQPAQITDLVIDSRSPSANFSAPGQNGGLRLSKAPSQSLLFKFNLAATGIPQNAKILRATLGLYVHGRVNKAPVDAEVYQLLQEWTETGASWLNRTETMRWSTAGAEGTEGALADRVAVSADKRSFRCVFDGKDVNRIEQSSCVNGSTWHSLDVTSLVQGWIAAPGTNNGMLIKAGGDGAVTIDLDSSEWKDEANHPSLIIEYTVPTPYAIRTLVPAGVQGSTSPSSVIRFKTSNPALPESRASAQDGVEDRQSAADE